MNADEAFALGHLLESIDEDGIDVRDVDIGKEQIIDTSTVFTTPKPTKTVFTLEIAVDADVLLEDGENDEGDTPDDFQPWRDLHGNGGDA